MALPERLAEAILRHGIHDPTVLDAMGKVPRSLFVPPEEQARVNLDMPLPIGQGQTISQPSLVARMTAELALHSRSRVLEVGTGCGYQTAILAHIAKDVFTIEVRSALSRTAEARLRGLGLTNVHYRIGDGTLGWPEEAPFDAIIVTAAGPKMPQSLLDQLAPGGRMVIPVGDEESQALFRVHRAPSGLEISELLPVRFVPIVAQDD